MKKYLPLFVKPHRHVEHSIGRTPASPYARRLRRAGAPRGQKRRLPQVFRDGKRPLVHPLGSPGRGQDDAGQDRRLAARAPLLHPLGRDVGRQGGARGDRVGAQAALLRPAGALPVHRRDSPLQQVAAGLAARRRRAGGRHPDRRHDREPLVRGDLAAVEPLSGLHPQAARGQGPRGAAPPGPDHRHGAARTRDRGRGDRCAATLRRRRRPQAAQHPGHPRRSHRRQADHHGPVRHRLPPTEHRPLRQAGRAALRRHLGLHQVGAGQRPQCGDLLPGAHAGRGRGAALHRPAAGDPRLGGHRAGQPQRAAAGQRLLRHGAQDRHARGAHHAGRDDDLPGHKPQEQLGLHGHQPGSGNGRARHDEPPRAAAPAQRPDTAHEGGRLRQGLQVRHDYAGHFAELEFLPESLAGTRFYEPDEQNAAEAKIAERIRTLWKGKY